jgi:hypothetical protein
MAVVDLLADAPQLLAVASALEQNFHYVSMVHILHVTKITQIFLIRKQQTEEISLLGAFP